MAQLEANLRTIEQDGLVWGASTLVPVGYGVKKLQITIVVEDEKVSLDDLQEKIAEDEDHVQSTDIAAMATVRCCVCGCASGADRAALLADLKVALVMAASGM
jgi:translation elongation factor EF-1beta